MESSDSITHCPRDGDNFPYHGRFVFPSGVIRVARLLPTQLPTRCSRQLIVLPHCKISMSDRGSLVGDSVDDQGCRSGNGGRDVTAGTRPDRRTWNFPLGSRVFIFQRNEEAFPSSRFSHVPSNVPGWTSFAAAPPVLPPPPMSRQTHEYLSHVTLD